MSVSRKNWSALSSLARQWTMEDEEELERERRRKTRDPSVSGDPDDDDDGSASERSPRSVSGAQPEPSRQADDDSAMQLQMDFVEMLRSRDERRRARHVETLRRQKQEEEEGDVAGAPESQARVELLGDVDLEEALLNPLCNLLLKNRPASPTSPKSPASTISTSSCHSRSYSSQSAVEAQDNDNARSNQSTPQKSSRKFVSSLSISFDKSSAPDSPQRLVSPISPRSPPQRPFSPTFERPQSPLQNGGAENGTTTSFEPAPRPAFTRQSSRTTSFRMLKKKEEQNMPLQRSASVRVSSKTESSKNPDEYEQQQSQFQRNSKQRISARSIQEKMEKLAQAAQKQQTKSPYQTDRSLFLMDEVLRKKNMFESEPSKGEKESGISKQDFRSFSSGISDRINRWLQKQSKPSTTSASADLRAVDILSKKILFERGTDESPLSPKLHSKSSH